MIPFHLIYNLIYKYWPFRWGTFGAQDVCPEPVNNEYNLSIAYLSFMVM